MTERTLINSFIVRIYRIDTDDRRKLAGQVESMDGTGKRLSFTTVDELAEILGSDADKPRRKGRKSPAGNAGD